jgi:hypothetical protein
MILMKRQKQLIRMIMHSYYSRVPKLNVAIKKAAIVDDEQESVSAMQSVSAQLACDEYANKRFGFEIDL